MKLRIRGNSIRLRLRRGEVERLATEGVVEERTDFGGGRTLTYALVAEDVPAVSAELDGARIVVRVPRAAAARWAATEDVGIECFQPAADGPLKIRVEKDFACTDAAADEPQDDAFPNPNHCP